MFINRLKFIFLFLNYKKQIVVICWANAIEGVQNMPPTNMPLWHKDYYDLQAIEKQQTREGLSALTLSVGKQN